MNLLHFLLKRTYSSLASNSRSWSVNSRIRLGLIRVSVMGFDMLSNVFYIFIAIKTEVLSVTRYYSSHISFLVISHLNSLRKLTLAYFLCKPSDVCF